MTTTDHRDHVIASQQAALRASMTALDAALSAMNDLPAAPATPVAEPVAVAEPQRKTMVIDIPATPVAVTAAAPAITIDTTPITLSVEPKAAPVPQPIAVTETVTTEGDADIDISDAVLAALGLDEAAFGSWLHRASIAVTGGTSGRRRPVSDNDADWMVKVYAGNTWRTNKAWRRKGFTKTQAVADMPAMNRLTVHKAIDRLVANGTLLIMNRHAQRNVRYVLNVNPGA